MEISLKVVGGAAFHSALNAVALSSAAAGATVEGDCGDGWRFFGATDSSGALATVIPHATCDFKATNGVAVSRLDDAAISGDTSLTFPPFVNPPSVSAVLDPAAPNGTNGWYTTNVALSWNIDNGGGTVTLDGCSSEVFATDGFFDALMHGDKLGGYGRPRLRDPPARRNPAGSGPERRPQPGAAPRQRCSQPECH